MYPDGWCDLDEAYLEIFGYHPDLPEGRPEPRGTGP